MSIWMSFVGGILKVKSSYQDDESASAKRVPSPRIQSAPRHIWFVNGIPQNPDIPSTCGLSSETAPLPMRLCATGRSSRSTRVVSSSEAQADRTPPPA